MFGIDINTTASLVTILTAALGAFLTVPRVVVYLWARYQERRLRIEFGSDLYDSEVLKRAAKYYVKPNCSNVDPAQEAEPKHLIVAEESLFRVVDRFVKSEDLGRHLVLLADSGMGKTAFVLNFYYRQLLNPRRSKRTALMHLGLPDADARIENIPNKAQTVLFLDALDEDTKAIADHRARIDELMRLCSGFRRIIITCRTQFFPTEEEIPKDTGLLKIEDRGMERATHEFRKMYLAPFNDRMVKRYLRKRYPIAKLRTRRKAWRVVKQIPLLSVRPMLLTHIPDLLESEVSYSTAYEIYRALATKWCEREAPWVPEHSLDAFSCRVAVDLFINRESRGAERIFKDELTPLARKWGIDLDDWQVRGRSLLNRDAVGFYKFAHRSILEFFVARVILEGEKGGILNEPRQQIIEYVSNEYPRSAGFTRALYSLHNLSTSPALTDQIRSFLRDAYGDDIWIQCSKEPLMKGYEQARQRAREIAEKVFIPGEQNLGAEIIGPPIFVTSGLVSQVGPLASCRLKDLNAGLEWKVVLFNENHPRANDRKVRSIRDDEVLPSAGWHLPSETEKLFALQQCRAKIMESYNSGQHLRIRQLGRHAKRIGSKRLATDLLHSIHDVSALPTDITVLVRRARASIAGPRL